MPLVLSSDLWTHLPPHLLSLLQCELGGSPAPAPAEGGGGGLLPDSPGALGTCGGGGPLGSEFGLGAALGAAGSPGGNSRTGAAARTPEQCARVLRKKLKQIEALALRVRAGARPTADERAKLESGAQLRAELDALLVRVRVRVRVRARVRVS